MQILSIVSHKGGAAKTTTAVMLAEDLARRGIRVLLLDADRQSSSSLLLGVEEEHGTVTSTGTRRLRYLSCEGWSLHELPARVDELRSRFDLLVVDTPSMDDPLARTWLSISSAALLVVPVEPLSLWTLPGAEKELAELRAAVNPRLKLLGVLPTLFNVDLFKQRRLLEELEDGGKRHVLSPIPWDSKLARRAAENQQHTLPLHETREAYRAASYAVIGELDLEARAQKADLPLPPSVSPVPAAPRQLEPAAWLRSRALLWGACAVALVSLIGFCLVRSGNLSGADRGAVSSRRESR